MSCDKNILAVEAYRCVGCHACQVACKLEHGLPPGPRTLTVTRLGPFLHGDTLAMSFLPTTCFHCDKPACVAACPTGAMQKREDGIVFSDAQLCIGCQTCAVACPYGIPRLNTDTGKIFKCDGCKDRISEGLWPSCALACPTGALIFGSRGRMVQERRQREATRVVQTFTLTQDQNNVQDNR